MPHVHKVWLSKLASLAFCLNSLLDKGSIIGISEAQKAIKSGKVVFFIKERFDVGNAIGEADFLSEEDDLTISEYFDQCGLSPSSLKVERNGLSWLLALTIEMMQQQEWTTFDDPTSF